MSDVQVITKQVDGHKYEPFEEAVVEVPEEHVGPVVDMLGQRKGQMVDMSGGAESGTLTRYLLSSLPLCCAYMSLYCVTSCWTCRCSSVSVLNTIAAAKHALCFSHRDRQL